MDIFAAIYFRGLHNSTMLEHCRVCLNGHIRGDLFSRISLPLENRDNKSLTKIN